MDWEAIGAIGELVGALVAGLAAGTGSGAGAGAGSWVAGGTPLGHRCSRTGTPAVSSARNSSR